MRDADSSGKPPGDRGSPFQEIFEGLNTAIVLLDHNFLMRELNPAAEDLLGISRKRAAGRPFLPFVDDDRSFADVLTRTLATGVSYANEVRLAPTEIHAEERAIECRVSTLARRDGEPRLIVEMTDATRRARISRENALLVQHGAGRQMIRQLAHEIKNPLGGLRGAAQLLGRQLDSADLREYTDVIISEADRLAALVDTLLGPGGPPKKAPVNIHEVIEYVLRLLETEIGPGIRLARDYDPGLPLIDLDRDQIVQALLNLIRNALIALEGQGNLRLRTRAELNFTVGDTRYPVITSIEIEDDGPGIPPELKDSIFYPLVTSRPEGTGLGLPASQELISRHGGLIEFESRPGRTVFFVRLPLTDGGSERHGAA